jgi:hypothetical protein
MTLRVVGAGLGRTGTHSLKLALEQLLGGPCYHMLEVLEHPEYVPYWDAALAGEPVDWNQVMDGYVAAVDWPASAFWRELSAAFPDAIVLLSTRSSTDAWWKSANATIMEAMHRMPADQFPRTLLDARFTPAWSDPDAAKHAYEAHNAAVRAEVPPARLVDWAPGAGWEPICSALGLAVPDEPFPHVNTTDDFRAMLGLDA